MKALLFAFLFSTMSLSLASGGEVSCQCPQEKCAPCEEDVGNDFFTEKCGPGLSKVKSCQRRDCQPVQDVASCRAKLQSSMSAPASPQVAVASTRSPDAATDMGSGVVDVVLAVGAVSVRKSSAQTATESLRKGMKVAVGDRILTGEDGRVRLRFEELSEIFVSPNSNVLVSTASVEKRERQGAKRTIMLDLVKGRVRSRVQGRYGTADADRESTFQVRTPAAVAGVRGTDFTVSFEQNDKKWITDVRTVSGAVHLDARASQLEANVTAGTFAAFVVPAPPIGASLFEIEAALARGFMTPVFRMSDQDLEELDRQMSFPPDQAASGTGGRSPASDVSLCQAPRGDFNQCSWTCEGNPKGSKVCRTDLANVSCVRRLCRASGAWAEATRLPANEGRACQGAVGSEPRVGDCGGYW